MAQTTPLGVRTPPETRVALKRAATDDGRSQSSLVSKILTDWLRERGYLTVAKKEGRRR